MDALLQKHKTKANAKNSARYIVQQQQQQTLKAHVTNEVVIQVIQ